jgi:hypothetical protein
MDAARLPPREENEEGSPPAFSHTYRITVEEPDGSTHEHRFTTSGQNLAIGDVLSAGQDGWTGPTIAVEEIDRHPDVNQAGAALAWPMSSRVQHESVSRPQGPAGT